MRWIKHLLSQDCSSHRWEKPFRRGSEMTMLIQFHHPPGPTSGSSCQWEDHTHSFRRGLLTMDPEQRLDRPSYASEHAKSWLFLQFKGIWWSHGPAQSHVMGQFRGFMLTTINCAVSQAWRHWARHSIRPLHCFKSLPQHNAWCPLRMPFMAQTTPDCFHTPGAPHPVGAITSKRL